MYKSVIDPPGSLEFAFDPLRALHAHEGSRLQWPEYPYKQVTIDRVRTKGDRSLFDGSGLSEMAVAGALLMASGQESAAMLLIEQHDRGNEDGGDPGWRVFERRFVEERAAFRQAKREFIRSEKAKVVSILDAQAARERAQQEQDEFTAWGARQIVKRYEDGRKYDGDGVTENGVTIPHGYGTLWVPEEKYTTTVGRTADIKRVIRYVGNWKDGFMHGNGTYYWASGESWKGSFIRDEKQGKGIYTSSEGDPDSLTSSRDTGRDGSKTEKDQQVLHPNQRIRYFDAGQHVCWGDELMCGCRVRLFNNRHFGDPLVSAVKRSNVGLEVETEAVVVRYDPQTDRHLLRKGETEETRWISLSNSGFRVLNCRPIARFLEV
ncbi:MORN repeat [Phytophthora infestans]|uniref:MORN repeat n=1 Tax=Phytophthora infestans TaxID=4787 RepID=A0A833SUK6_PHYIN|nr:MORN repeat [Phytophthora infestans]